MEPDFNHLIKLKMENTQLFASISQNSVDRWIHLVLILSVKMKQKQILRLEICLLPKLVPKNTGSEDANYVEEDIGEVSKKDAGSEDSEDGEDGHRGKSWGRINIRDMPRTSVTFL